MPQLIEAGKVYAALPPLYGIKLGKDKYIYLRDRMEYVKYIQKEFSKNNKVATADKKALSSRELSSILYKNIDYEDEVNRVAKNHAIDPVLLESILILIHNKASYSQISKSIKKQFRFVSKVSKDKDTIIIEGLVNSKYQTVFVNDMLIAESKPILDYIEQNTSMVYRVNNELVSLYELMHMFNKSAPNSIQRYKGLGEMDGKRLFDSTLDPTKRTLIRYTMDDVKAEIDTIKYYEDDMSRLLTDTKLSKFDVME